MNDAVPTTTPQEIAPETWLIPNMYPAGPDGFIAVNTMLIRGAEPVIVDTGCPIHKELWKEKVFSLVDPEDVRWIFLSHDDGDHTGSLLDALEMCPNATLICNFFIVERLGLEYDLPLDRMCWLQPGESFDAGDRTLHLFKPPIFDGPTTRGLYDAKTAAMWIVDSFAHVVPGEEALYDVRAVPQDLYDETFPMFNSLISPWHQWLDPAVYSRHLDDVEGLGLLTVASAHGSVHTGPAIHDAFERVRRMAGQPINPGPGPDALEQMLAEIAAAESAPDATAPDPVPAG
ncbi:MAG: MBL fold metallo-hydrolase [Ilumatobacter sp.]|nr:MBL fold metallo-hydrolase [Ilumatobacter sp.]